MSKWLKKFQIAGLIFVALLIVLSTASGDSPQLIPSDKQAKPEEVRELLTLTNGMSTGKQMAVKLMDGMSGAAKNVPDSVWREIRDSIDWEQLTDSLIPIYRKHLSRSVVKDATKFYNSSAGRSFIQAQHEILLESMPIYQEFLVVILKEVAKKLLEKGYTPPVMSH